jgi:hypothetical protein
MKSAGAPIHPVLPNLRAASFTQRGMDCNSNLLNPFKSVCGFFGLLPARDANDGKEP